MPTRRDFLLTTIAAGAAQLVLPVSSAFAATTSKPSLRTITYNILKCHGYSTRPEAKPFLDAAKVQVPTRLALELDLYKSDIISFQEAPPEKIVAQIADQLKMKYAFFPGGWNGAVLTKFEIRNPQNCPLVTWKERPKDLFTRHWGRADILTPGGEIKFFSAHLFPSDPSIRAQEVTEMLKLITPELEKGNRVILQGDLNHKPDGPEYPRWVKAGLIDVFQQIKQQHERTGSYSSHEPVKRIDYIWASAPLAKQATDSRMLFERAFRTNPDDPTSTALSDHIPVLADFS